MVQPEDPFKIGSDEQFGYSINGNGDFGEPHTKANHTEENGSLGKRKPNYQVEWAESDHESSTSSREVKEMREKLSHLIRPNTRAFLYDDEPSSELKSLSTSSLDKTFEYELPTKLVPLFLGNSLNSNHDGTQVSEEPLGGDLRASLANSKLTDAIVQCYVFRSTKFVSGEEQFKARIRQAHPSWRINELVRYDNNSSIKFIVQLRLYLRMKVEEYERLMQKYVEYNSSKQPSPPSQKLKVRLRNSLAPKAFREFVEGGTQFNSQQIAYAQSLNLLNEKDRRAKLEELDRLERFKNDMAGYTSIPHLGLAIRPNLFHINSELELRFDFKFPASSLGSFSLEVDGLKLL